jgi:hypothetical protein
MWKTLSLRRGRLRPNRIGIWERPMKTNARSRAEIGFAVSITVLLLVALLV